MYSILKIILLVGVLSFQSCGGTETSTKSVAPETDDSNTMETYDKSMQEEGYSKGYVKKTDNTKCQFVIVNEKTNTAFDPINFEEDAFRIFKLDDEKIYYKFLPLRMPNRCNEAQPISLVDIKKRED